MRTPSKHLAHLILLLLAAGPTYAQVAQHQREAMRSVLLQNAVLSVRGNSIVDTLALPDSAHSTSLATLPDGWIAGGTRATAEGSDLFLYRSDGRGTTEIPVPAGEGSRLRAFATPIVSQAGLAGVVWLEGEQTNRLAVRAATRVGDRWGQTEMVSTPGPGSQVALTALALADGSWIAVWTRVDEEGDAETVWSTRSGGVWSEPQRVHENNTTHDVQPVLAPIRGGAVVAWSSFDGRDYRMRSARFDGRSWLASAHFGGRGAGNPRFFDGPAGKEKPGSYLLYSTVAPSSWSVVELDETGERVATGELDREPHDAGPVLLLPAIDGSAVISWPPVDPDAASLLRPVVMSPAPPDGSQGALPR